MKTRYLTQLIRVEVGLIVLAIVVFIWQQQQRQPNGPSIKPQAAFDFRLTMSFDAGGDEVSVATYLPQIDQRQHILSEQYQANHMERDTHADNHGTLARWSGKHNADLIAYQATIQAYALNYQISPELEIPTLPIDEWQNELQATSLIQVHDPEIHQLWQSIKPDDTENALQVLQQIYQYTYQLERLPIKGATDALTALRLGAASCNGKSRLFVALARFNGIPARLVGGVILNEGNKKTSHQWLEVNLDNQWVPFDPSNGHFAHIPAHYLTLYRGDKALFKHTRDINFDYQFSIAPTVIAPTLLPYTQAPTSFNLAYLLQQLNLPNQLSAVFLMLPFCALIITVLRNLFGLKSFGIFMPMLVGSACAFVGLKTGLIGVVLIVLFAFIGQILMHKLKLLKIPRLAIVITLVNAATIGLLMLLDTVNSVQFGVLSLFPVIIISFIADKLYDLADDGDWGEMLITTIGSLVSIILCYLAIKSASLQGLFAIYPELYLLLLAMQLYMGRWTGLRISELLRFRTLATSNNAVLGINGRNHQMVAKLNSSANLRLAADKLYQSALISTHFGPASRA